MIKYKKRIVAFIDVLGFESLVFDDSQILINKYFESLKKALHVLPKAKPIQSIYISDSIILLSENSIDGLISTINFIRYLQSSLLKIQIVVRGAISVGDIYLNKTNNIIVGPALVNSYKLEQEAKFPRVILDRKLIKHFNYTSTSAFFNKVHSIYLVNRNGLLLEDSDHFLYINYLSYFFADNTNFRTNNYVKNLYQLTQTSFLQNLNLDKYGWLIICIEAMQKQLEFIDSFTATSSKTKATHNFFKRVLPYWLEKFKEI